MLCLSCFLLSTGCVLSGTAVEPCSWLPACANTPALRRFTGEKSLQNWRAFGAAPLSVSPESQPSRDSLPLESQMVEVPRSVAPDPGYRGGSGDPNSGNSAVWRPQLDFILDKFWLGSVAILFSWRSSLLELVIKPVICVYRSRIFLPEGGRAPLTRRFLKYESRVLCHCQPIMS